MNFLIIGGTRFLGRHLVTAALARNHQVTIFNRGNYPSASPEVETILGDRNQDLSKLHGRRWDAVIDTCGFLPRTVHATAELLADSVNQYVFISSQSVYADLSSPGVNETAPLRTLTEEQLAEANAIDSSGQTSALTYGPLYGGLKALCEKAVEQAMPGRVLTVRPGLIVGPDDYTDRFPYWVARVASGGEVLAPGRPDRHVQFIDVRDLAEWIVQMAENEKVGVYNANGRPGSITMRELLAECKTVSGSDASFTWASEEFLLRENVTAWTTMPLWLPEEAAPHLRGFMFVDCEKAIDTGLTFRPLRETIEATLVWHQTEQPEKKLNAGLNSDKERQLLDDWHART